MQRCPCCGEVKSFEDFPRNRRTSSGYSTYCKPCHNAKGQASRQRSGGARKYHLWLRYGLTLEDVALLLRRQGDACAICGAADPQQVDHCHETGKVRGLLCFNCNGGLGQFKDSPESLRAAALYVEAARERDDLPIAVGRRRRTAAPPSPDLFSGPDS